MSFKFHKDHLSSCMRMITDINKENLVQFVDTYRRPGSKVQPGTLKSYLLSFRMFLEFASETAQVKLDEPDKLSKLTSRLMASLRTETAQRRLEVEVEDQCQLLPAESREAYLTSEYVIHLQEYVEKGEIEPEELPHVRNHLMLSLLLFNGHRPSVLMNLTTQIVASASQLRKNNEWLYIMTVTKHKTSASRGSAVVVLPQSTFMLLRLYIVAVSNQMEALGRSHSSTNTRHAFLSNQHQPFADVSTINRHVKSAWKNAGCQATFGPFSATKNRKSLTTEVRNRRPEMADAVATQLGHTRRTADRFYRLSQSHRSSLDTVTAIMEVLSEPLKDVSLPKRIMEEEEDHPLTPPHAPPSHVSRSPQGSLPLPLPSLPSLPLPSTSSSEKEILMETATDTDTATATATDRWKVSSSGPSDPDPDPNPSPVPLPLPLPLPLPSTSSSEKEILMETATDTDTATATDRWKVSSSGSSDPDPNPNPSPVPLPLPLPLPLPSSSSEKKKEIHTETATATAKATHRWKFIPTGVARARSAATLAKRCMEDPYPNPDPDPNPNPSPVPLPLPLPLPLPSSSSEKKKKKKKKKKKEIHTVRWKLSSLGEDEPVQGCSREEEEKEEEKKKKDEEEEEEEEEDTTASNAAASDYESLNGK